jgi:hypothetical protein
LYFDENQKVSTYLPHQGKYQIFYNKKVCFVEKYVFYERVTPLFFSLTDLSLSSANASETSPVSLAFLSRSSPPPTYVAKGHNPIAGWHTEGITCLIFIVHTMKPALFVS